MKKLLCTLLLATLLLTSAALGEELEPTVTIVNIYANEDYSAYEETASQYQYQIKEWQSGDTPIIRITAPQKVSGDFAYAMLPDGTAMITKLLSERKVVEIPSEIDGVTVSHIGGIVSSGLSPSFHVAAAHPMEKLIVPDTVKRIGHYAFFRMNDLKELVLPDTLEYLDDSCIVDPAQNLKTAALPASLKYFGESMSWGVRLNAKKLELPKGLEGIGEWAFTYGNWQQVILPGTLRDVKEEAFKECRKLTSVTMEEGITRLGKSMFKDCTALGKLTFPASMREISEFAFDGCKKLSTVKFAEGSQLQKVADGAFANCTSLKSITLPEGTREICAEAFYGCKALSSVTLPASVSAIGDYAFEGCSKKLTLTVEEGSWADQWAQENGVKVKYPKKK